MCCVVQNCLVIITVHQSSFDIFSEYMTAILCLDGSNDFWVGEKIIFMPLVPMSYFASLVAACICGLSKLGCCLLYVVQAWLLLAGKLGCCLPYGLHLPLVIKNGPRHRHYM